MNENNRQEFIELYLQGELEGEKLHDFEEQLKVDKTLQEDVTLSKEVQEALDEVQGEQLLAEQLSSFNDKYVTKSQVLGDSQLIEAKKENSNSRRNILIVVLLTVAALAIFWIWQQQNTTPKIEAEQIFASYYEPYSSNVSARSSDEDEAYLNAIKAYDNANYSEAITSLTQRISSKPNEISTQLLLGNSYLNLSPPETEKAIEVFKNIGESGSDLYSNTANWDLALAYLQVNQTKEAKVIFEDLSKNTSGRYANLAKQVLSDW
jgi:hypothetical protein